ncbi:MAG: hypothetical protein HFG20_01900 [Anaerotruncus sp.]|nr:hypothetical protein [Anaerotruncus sp.]
MKKYQGMRPIRHYQVLTGGRSFQRSVEEEREYFYALIRNKLPEIWTNRIAALNIMVVVFFLTAFFFGSLFAEKPTVSKIEKRDLTRFPTFSEKALFSGEWTHQIDLWFSDTFPLREGFVALSAVVDESRGVRKDNVRIVAPTGNAEVQDIPPEALLASSSAPEPPPAASSFVTAASSEPEQTSSASSSAEEQSEQSSSASSQAQENTSMGTTEAAPTEISNGTFVYKGMAMSLYGASPQGSDAYVNTLNSYQADLPDVKIYNMIIPTAIEYYVPEKYKGLTTSQKAVIDHVYSTLDGRIRRVDAYSKLEQHLDEYLYFRTDHHWTGLGAYYAYEAFCETAGLTPVKLEDCETRRLEDFLGTMYAQTQDSTLLQNQDYVDYYIFPREYEAVRYDRNAPYTPIPHTLWGEYAQSPNCYSVFLHGDFPLISIKTDLHNGRKIMVVKESFGNAFAPFLINNYEEVYIVDQRYFQLPAIDFIKTNGINELIFANNSFAVCTPYHVNCINGLRYQYSAPAVTPTPAPKPAEQPKQQPEPAEEQSKPEEQASSTEQSRSSRFKDIRRSQEEQNE